MEQTRIIMMTIVMMIMVVISKILKMIKVMSKNHLVKKEKKRKPAGNYNIKLALLR